MYLQDNEVGQGSGYYNNQQFFKGKHGHSSFVPLCGLLKAEDFENGSTASSGKLRRNKKLVDELDLKRRSNSQQQHLADYKMKQNLNRLKNSSNGSNEGSSRAGTDDNFSPSILGSLEQDIVNWTPSSQSSPPRQNRFQTSPEEQRKNDLSLIGTPQDQQPNNRDPYASEDFVVAAEGMYTVNQKQVVNVEELFLSS